MERLSIIEGLVLRKWKQRITDIEQNLLTIMKLIEQLLLFYPNYQYMISFQFRMLLKIKHVSNVTIIKLFQLSIKYRRYV